MLLLSGRRLPHFDSRETQRGGVVPGKRK